MAWSSLVVTSWCHLVMQDTVAGIVAHIKATTPVAGSLADMLLATAHASKGLPHEADLFPEVAALFFAGIDTTGHTGTWMLYVPGLPPCIALMHLCVHHFIYYLSQDGLAFHFGIPTARQPAVGPLKLAGA